MPQHAIAHFCDRGWRPSDRAEIFFGSDALSVRDLGVPLALDARTVDAMPARLQHVVFRCAHFQKETWET
ncbi:hypothetical protein AB4Y32_21305 [Paraburkholderia phymatum]|uniref:Uncharacterized protein n=1 Tax=Paraburkholderia phymatum TaxID=148447 RepID=A0ACC6U3W2_9BURK